ncbi:MAG: hypothetical protein ACE14P_13515 [Methanotrichaceae archaeon]
MFSSKIEPQRFRAATDIRSYYDKNGFGASTKGVFDCTCYKVPTKALISV